MRKRANKTLRTLGWKIQKLRKRVELTQEQLADEMGISRVYMGYIEQSRESPSLRLLMRLARRLRVKIQDLFHR